MKTTLLFLSLAFASSPAFSAEPTNLESSNAKDLAQQLANPIASLISVPIQSNYDFGIGPGDGTKWTTNIQPVIPFDLNDDWNVISRTILPVIDQEGIVPGGGSDAFGLGDTVQSVFFSPKESDLIWDVGPVFLIPTATDNLLGGEQWGIGPTVVALKQTGPWTVGALANHLWSFAGEDDRDEVNATFLQPFVSYITDIKTTFAVNQESTYDWDHEQWTVPVNFVVVSSSKSAASRCSSLPVPATTLRRPTAARNGACALA